MKKVMFMIPNLGGGGAEKVLVNLVNNIDKTKFDITVLTLFNEGVNIKYLNNDVHYKYIFSKKIKGLKHIIKLFGPKFLFKRFIKERYDCIISYLEGETTRIISGCNYNAKLISWVHTENQKDYYVAYRNKKEVLKSYSKMSNIIFVSDNVLESFNDYTSSSFNSKEKIIKNVIDFDDIIKKSKEKVDLSKNCFRIICIGRLTKVKDFERMVDIIKKINLKHKNIELLILGTGIEEENIKKHINKSGVNNIKMIGYQSNPYKYLNNSNLYVCCSHFEGFSTTTNEALFLNIPIVTTDCSGMREILENGKCGIIVPDDDSKIYDGILKMIEDNDFRKKIVEEQKKKIIKMKEENAKNVKLVEMIMEED